MAESTPHALHPDRLIRKTTSIAQLLARRVLDTPDREAYRYPVGDQWRSMTWR
jgi:long-chain acyl-CoA synthetase